MSTVNSRSIYGYSFVAAGGRERESQILVSCHVGCANSFLVNSFFASLFFPRCTRHCQEFSRCVFVVIVSRLSRFTYTFLTRPHAWLIWSERVGSNVTELFAVINVIRVYFHTQMFVCLYHVGDFSIEIMIFSIP